MPPAYCSNCGAAVSGDANACPECGADEGSSWSEDAYAQSLGIPEDDFDYDEFVEREFGGEKHRIKPQGLHWFWWLVGLALLAALILQWVL